MSYYGNTSYSAAGAPGGGQQQPQNANSGGGGFYGGATSSTGAGTASPNYSANQWSAPNPQQHTQHTQQSQAQFNQWTPSAAPSQTQTSSAPNAGAGGGSSSTSANTDTQAWDPSLAATIAKAALNSGKAEDVIKNFLGEYIAKLLPGLEALLKTLRTYFAVDNNYVLQKIKCILFPFLKKDWTRNLKGYGGQDGATPVYDLPIADENAPDLYIPFMSLITYVLLAALVYGNAGKFNPEVIPDVTTKCFFTQVLEVVLMRLGFYILMSTPAHQHQHNNPVKVIALLDLLAYTGYKYLGLSVNMLLGLTAKHFYLGATRVYYLTFLYTASAASFFMFKTMSNAGPGGYNGGGSTHTNQKLMVLGFAAAQFATMWFVSQTKNL